mmetsp:Transcript_49322/g.121029  ORF Transcript_49322/g.121029 Transcript_49322/m.121029 type:complete len:443 (-) Transcript_49322:891-2219(-)
MQSEAVPSSSPVVPGLGLRRALNEDAVQEAIEPEGVLKPAEERRLLRSSRRFSSVRQISALDDEGEQANALTKNLSFDVIWSEDTQTWVLSTEEEAFAEVQEEQVPTDQGFTVLSNTRLALNITQPPILLTPFGQYWANDLVSLPHNAIRRELLDAYVIFYSIEVRTCEFTLVEVDLFYMWWASFRAFMDRFIEAEEAHVFPWIEAVDSLENGEVRRDARLRQQTTIATILDIIDTSHPNFNAHNLVDGIRLLKNAVDKLVLCLNAYMRAKERFLPPIINRHYQEADKWAFERQYVKFFMACANSGINVPLLQRWMKNGWTPKEAAEWRYEILGPGYSATGWMKESKFRRHVDTVIFFSTKRREFMSKSILVTPLSPKADDFSDATLSPRSPVSPGTPQSPNTHPNARPNGATSPRPPTFSKRSQMPSPRGVLLGRSAPAGS